MAIYQQTEFFGGISEGSKKGYKGGFQNGSGLDYRSDPDKLQVLQQLKKISSSTVVDLLKWGVEYNGKHYFYGDTGHIYDENALTVTDRKTVSNSNGQGLAIFNDELWYASQRRIGKATGISGAPTFTDDYFVTPQYESPDYAQSTATNTYTLATSISEAAADKLGWTTSVDNFIGLTITVVARGTGNWTFTLHNSSNTLLGSVTITNANLPGTAQFCRINFPSVVNLTVGQSYHLHITSTVADGTVRVNTSSDLSTGEASIHQVLDDFDVDQSSGPTAGSIQILTNSYTVPTAISEAATALRSFTPTVSSLKGISLLINSKGSATWTLTVHDSNNVTVGTATLTTGNVKERGTWVRFDFTTPLELIVDVTYHFHLTVPSGTSIVSSGTASDLSTAYYKTYWDTLDYDVDYHPMKEFGNKLCIGHGRNLMTIDDSEVVVREALVFPKGERVRALETIGDYLAILTWKGTSLSDYGRGRIYFWDGFTEGFNAFVEIDGQGNAMRTYSNNLMLFHGTQGEMSVYTGAVTKVRRIKNVKSGISVEVMPGAIDTWEGILYFGLSNVSSSTVDTMVYSYGRKDKDYPMSLNKDYPISTGTVGTGVKIGMILGVSASKFFIGWKDGSSYGLDIIDTSNKQTAAQWDDLRFDAGDPNREKEIKAVSLRFEQLNYTPNPTPTTGDKITLQYRLDNKGNYTTLGVVDPVNDSADRDITYKSFPAPTDTGGVATESRFFEIEWRMLLTSTVASSRTAPVILTLEMEYEPMEEFQIGSK